MALMGALGCGQDASLPRFAPPVTPAPVEAGPSQEAEPPQSGSAGGTSETRTVAHSTAPAPPQHGGNETASEAGGPEAMEGEAAPSRTAETAFALPAPAALPPTPGNFRAGASSSSAVDLSWDAAAGADSYEVRYREDGGTWENWTGVGDVTSFTVTGLAAQTEYEFEVRTVVGTEQSAVATASAATTADPAPRDPNCEDLPPSISVSATSSTSVRVSWRADRAPACENLFDVSGPGLNLSGTSDTSRTVGDLDPGTEYCYTVSMDGRGSDRIARRRTRRCATCPSRPRKLGNQVRHGTIEFRRRRRTARSRCRAATSRVIEPRRHGHSHLRVQVHLHGDGFGGRLPDQVSLGVRQPAVRSLQNHCADQRPASGRVRTKDQCELGRHDDGRLRTDHVRRRRRQP